MKTKSGKARGFTIIELLVTISVTIIALSTFFKLYTSSVRSDRSTAIRASANVLGEQIIDQITKSIRLIALNSEFNDWNLDVGSIFLQVNGSDDGVSGVTFSYLSPFGGPITKLSTDTTGAAPLCDGFTMMASASITNSTDRIKIMSRRGVWTADVTWTFSGDEMVAVPSTLQDTGNNNFSEDCGVYFPAGTLVTGRDKQYTLSFSITGSDSVFTFQNTDGIIYKIDSAESKYHIPFMIVEFLREWDDGVSVLRQWSSGVGLANSEIQQIKAVRIGFILVSDQEMRLKSEDDTSFSVEYCPFRGVACYTHTDRNRAAFMFRRVIHIRNFDYIERNQNVSL